MQKCECCFDNEEARAEYLCTKDTCRNKLKYYCGVCAKNQFLHNHQHEETEKLLATEYQKWVDMHQNCVNVETSVNALSQQHSILFTRLNLVGQISQGQSKIVTLREDISNLLSKQIDELKWRQLVKELLILNLEQLSLFNKRLRSLSYMFDLSKDPISFLAANFASEFHQLSDSSDFIINVKSRIVQNEVKKIRSKEVNLQNLQEQEEIKAEELVKVISNMDAQLGIIFRATDDLGSVTRARHVENFKKDEGERDQIKTKIAAMCSQIEKLEAQILNHPQDNPKIAQFEEKINQFFNDMQSQIQDIKTKQQPPSAAPQSQIDIKRLQEDINYLKKSHRVLDSKFDSFNKDIDSKIEDINQSQAPFRLSFEEIQRSQSMMGNMPIREEPSSNSLDSLDSSMKDLAQRLEQQMQKWDSFEQTLNEQLQEIREGLERRLIQVAEETDKKVNQVINEVSMNLDIMVSEGNAKKSIENQFQDLVESTRTFMVDLGNVQHDIQDLQFYFKIKDPDFKFTIHLKSQTLRTFDEKLFLMQELKKRFPMKAIAFIPIYRASVNGWTCKAFHEICDGQGPSITLFSSQSGKRCGAFTNASWDQVSGQKEDPYAFLFSVDQLKTFPVQNSQNAIFCKDDRGPSFGLFGADLSASTEPFNEHQYGCRSDNRQDTYRCDIKVLMGMDGYGGPWKASEIEVFLVEFI